MTMHATPERALQPRPAIDVDERTSPRFTLLIRTGKLIVEDREYLCIIRDLSATGASIRGFHPVPAGQRIAIEFQNGERHAVGRVWQQGHEAGFEFLTPIEVDEIVAGYSKYRKRDLRFAIDLPVTLAFADRTVAGRLANVSRQGGNLICQSVLPIDLPVRMQGAGLPEIEARIRWRNEGVYGLVFDTTFSLGDLSLLIASLNERSAAALASASAARDVGDGSDALGRNDGSDGGSDPAQKELPF